MNKKGKRLRAIGQHLQTDYKKSFILTSPLADCFTVSLCNKEKQAFFHNLFYVLIFLCLLSLRQPCSMLHFLCTPFSPTPLILLSYPSLPLKLMGVVLALPWQAVAWTGSVVW